MSDRAGGVATLHVRRATRADVDALLRLEMAFPSDRISRASFLRFLDATTANAWVAVVLDAAGSAPAAAAAPERVVGDAIVTYRRGFHGARLISLVTDPAHRGRGVASALLAAAEAAAHERGCVSVRLEVRVDNEAAIALYRRRGYEVVGTTDDFYEDGSDALRMRKRLRGDHARLLNVPYRPQSLPFTCGAASLQMAMRSLGHATSLGPAEELALWREATTVFMLAGHGGTSAHGLAVAALRRGFDAEVWVERRGVPFLDTVRDAAKKQVIALAHAGFLAEFERFGGRERVGEFGVEDVVAQLRAGRVPLVLVSGARLYAERIPHWVVATGWD
ncbi:MAG: peptidase C39 family protein, partial [Trueperaceae bacterium]|nr:peptidase C39 family protein [Trueperaceae bacterium]